MENEKLRMENERTLSLRRKRVNQRPLAAISSNVQRTFAHVILHSAFSIKTAFSFNFFDSLRHPARFLAVHPQRLDLFSFLDKRRSLGQQHLSGRLKRILRKVSLKFKIENTFSKGSKPF